MGRKGTEVAAFLTHERHVAQYNQHRRPFVWTATADTILQKVARLCNVISGTER
jgi:putative transposase